MYGTDWQSNGVGSLNSHLTTIGDVTSDDQELVRISQALDELSQMDSSLSQIVDLKFFCGFSLARSQI